MAAVLPAAAAARLRDLVAAAPDGELRILHRGARAVYLALPGRGGRETAVGVVAAAECLLPVAMHVTPRAAPFSVERAEVRAGVLRLDGLPVPVVRTVDLRVPDLRGRVSAAARGRVVDDAADVASLVGSGDGLTPEGDDVLVGRLAAYRAGGVPTPVLDAAIARLAPTRTTTLSASLLACAVRGEVSPRLSVWLTAVGTDREAEAGARLLELGQSSGAALLRGAREVWLSLSSSDSSPARSDPSPTRSDSSAARCDSSAAA
jgi:Protein of unknown function (DUF2877)